MAARKQKTDSQTPQRPEEQWKHQGTKAGAGDVDTEHDAEQRQGNRSLRKTASGANPHVDRHRN